MESTSPLPECLVPYLGLVTYAVPSPYYAINLKELLVLFHVSAFTPTLVRPRSYAVTLSLADESLATEYIPD